MFKLNRLTTTKDGKKVTPYLITGGVVFAFDSNKNAVTLQLDDFEVNSPKKRRVRQPVVMVKGTAPREDDRVNKKAFELNESGGLGGVYSEQPHILKPPTTITKPQEATIIPDIIEITNGDEKVEFVSSTEPGADPIPTFESKDYNENEDLPRRDYTYNNKSVSIKSSGESKHYLLAVEDVISTIDADDFYGSL